MQDSQLLDIFCENMSQFERNIQALKDKEAALTRQSKRIMRTVMSILILVLLGIGGQIYYFATSMAGVSDNINELSRNVGYTQGILNAMSTQMKLIDNSVKSVPNMVNLVSAFNQKLPLLVSDMKDIEHELDGFEGNMSKLDTSLTGMNGSVYRLNFQMQLMANHTRQFGRMMP